MAKVSISGGYSDGHHPFRFAGAGELDDEKAVLKLRLADLNPACQAKASLELPRGDAAMEKVARLLLALLAANGKFAVLGAHLELIWSEARDRERDAQGFRLSFQELDIVGRVAGLGLCRAVRPAGRGETYQKLPSRDVMRVIRARALSTNAARRSGLCPRP